MDELDAPRFSMTDVFGIHDSDEADILARHDPYATIRARPSDPSRAALSALDRLRETGDPSRRIAKKSELGSGGMGVVYLAEQRSLGRAVAVKELHEDQRGPVTAQALLQEAWVLGAIEHPNVVPVYDLMLDDNGAPVVVLKRIEGESWIKLLGDDARVRERYGAADALLWHLGVLVDVANAASFAHSRGLLHRDIKPENVMVGRFGEVYLVDWGVAVALKDDGTGRFPLASQVERFAGTPRYMAPEMLGGRAAELGVHTDVYLLGATLFHILAGRAPHLGETIMEIATNLATDDPVLPDGVPSRLAEICKNAMMRDPSARFASADAFRAAITEYMRRRDANVLAEEGHKKLTELQALASAKIEDAQAHRLTMFNTYSEARLGFRLARRLWPDSEEVKVGIARATETMVRYLLEQGDIASATTLVGQLERPLPPDLASRYESARHTESTQKRRIEKLEKLGHEHDPAVGRRARLIAYSVLAAAFLITGVVGYLWKPYETHGALLAVAVAQITALALVGLIGRRALLSTALNRQLFFAVAGAFAGKLLIHGVIAMIDAPPWHAQVLDGVVYCAVGATVAFNIQPRFWPISIAFGLGAIAGAAWPEGRYAYLALANLVMLICVIWVHFYEGRQR